MTSGLVTARGNIIIPERLRHNWSIVSHGMFYIVGDSIPRFCSFMRLSRLNAIRGLYQFAQNPNKCIICWWVDVISFITMFLIKQSGAT